MIDILMATYNGEKYIKEQIDSIIGQTYKEWKLYIRDDGSNDKTVDIIYDYVNRFPDKIYYIMDDKSIHSSKLNFKELMRFSTNEYIMFADQDDVWLPEKIEKTLQKMNEIEFEFGKEIPMLVHCDLKVVDEHLNIIDGSSFRYTGINPNINTFNRILFSNITLGCAIMINKSLLELSKNMNERCYMHDYWISLIASCFGHIAVIEEPLILYRQHNDNSCGASEVNTVKNIKKTLRNIFDIKKIKYFTSKEFSEQLYRERVIQAEEFERQFGRKLNSNNKKVITRFIKINQYKLFYKKYLVIRHKFLPHNKFIALKYILILR